MSNEIEDLLQRDSARYEIQRLMGARNALSDASYSIDAALSDIKDKALGEMVNATWLQLKKAQQAINERIVELAKLIGTA